MHISILLAYFHNSIAIRSTSISLVSPGLAWQTLKKLFATHNIQNVDPENKMRSQKELFGNNPKLMPPSASFSKNTMLPTRLNKNWKNIIRLLKGNLCYHIFILLVQMIPL